MTQKLDYGGMLEGGDKRDQMLYGKRCQQSDLSFILSLLIPAAHSAGVSSVRVC